MLSREVNAWVEIGYQLIIMGFIPDVGIHAQLSNLGTFRKKELL